MGKTTKPVNSAKPRSKILILDSDALCWTVFTRIANPSKDKIKKEIIAGFLHLLVEAQKYARADYVVFAWDSPRNYRKDIYPEYKIKRSNKRKEASDTEKTLHKVRIQQFKMIRDFVLPELGFCNVFLSHGFEGDDIIASVVKSNPTAEIVMYARDNDVFQLINSRVIAYDWIARKTYNQISFKEKYGIEPELWGRVKSIAGCPGDEVPGVSGIGYNRAIQYITGKMKPTSKYYKDIKNSEETINLTRRLVVLPFENTPKYSLQKDTVTPEKINAVQEELPVASPIYNITPELIKVFCQHENKTSFTFTKRKKGGTSKSTQNSQRKNKKGNPKQQNSPKKFKSPQKPKNKQTTKAKTLKKPKKIKKSKTKIQNKGKNLTQLYDF